MDMFLLKLSFVDRKLRADFVVVFPSVLKENPEEISFCKPYHVSQVESFNNHFLNCVMVKNVPGCNKSHRFHW